MGEIANIITEKKLIEYLDIVGVGKNITKQEKMQFIEIAKAYGLNPFKREIYIAAYGEGQYRQCSILVGYEVYLKRAELSKMMDGYTVTTSGNIPDMKAIITIYRKDWTRPFAHEVEYSEYVQTAKDGKLNKFWREKPKTMLKKVAISQGFRLCFPNDFGGLPYTSEEMPEIQEIIDITPPLSKSTYIKEETKPESKINIQPEIQETVEIIEHDVSKDEGITDQQIKAIHTIAGKKKIDLKELIFLKYEKESTKEMSKNQASELIEELQNIKGV